MLKGVLCSEWCVLLLHSTYEDTKKGQRSGKVVVEQAIIEIYCRQRLPISTHHIFPSHIVFVWGWVRFYRELQCQHAWAVASYFYFQATLANGYFCGGEGDYGDHEYAFRLALSRGIFCADVCVTQNGIVLATFLGPSTIFPGELVNGGLILLISGLKCWQVCAQIRCP